MKNKVKTILLTIFLILMILSLVSLITWYLENKKVEKIVKTEEKYLVEDKDNIHLEETIFKENTDTVAWLKVSGTNINYPVVQTKDNEYYLNHDFNKQRNSTGWIFMDYENTFNDQNIVIYGHHRRDKSMFGDIDLLFNSNFYKENNNEILLIREKEVLKYKVFSVYKTSSTDKYNFKNIENFDKKIKNLRKKSEIYFSENIENSSQIITLSTCHNNNIDRLVVHGILIN